MKKLTTAFTFCFLLTGINFCAKHSNTEHAGLKNLIEKDTQNSQYIFSAENEPLRATSALAYAEGFNTSPGNTSACDFWKSLPEEKSADYFQIITDLTLKSGGLKSVKRGEYTPRIENDEILARHIPGRVPHLMYFLSHENDDILLVDLLKFFLTPPSIKETRRLLEESKAKGFWSGLTNKFAAYTGWGVLGGRNEKIISGIEAKVPGVFSGKVANLTGKIAFETLMPFTDVKHFDRTHFAALSVLAKKVPLFAGDSWEIREKELRQSMAILDRPDIDSLSFEEKVCHFAIFHRVQAQIIKIKGVEGAPQLNEKELLVDMPATDETAYPVQNINGLFEQRLSGDNWSPVLVTKPWITDICDKIQDTKDKRKTGAALRYDEMPLIRPIAVRSARESIAALRYFVTLSSFRNDRSFLITRENRMDMRPPLLKKSQMMAFALFGLSLNSIAEELLPINEEGLDLIQGRVHLAKDDSDANIAYLLHTVIEAIESFQRLKSSPTWIDEAILVDTDHPEEEDRSALESYSKKDGIVDKLQGIRSLLVSEVKIRIAQEHSSSKELQRALDRVRAHQQLFPAN